MDIEDDRSSEVSEEDFIVEPITFKLPQPKPQSRSVTPTKKGKKSKSKEMNPEEKIRELYLFNKNVLESKKREVIDSKNEKLSNKIFENLAQQTRKSHNINIMTIKVYPNYQSLLNHLYNDVQEKLRALTETQSIIVRIDRKIGDIQDLIAFTLQGIEENTPEETKKNNNKKNKKVLPKSIFLMFGSELEQYNNMLPDYCKYLVEELLLDSETTKLFMIFPNISAVPNLPDQDYNLMKFQICTPKKMFAKLIVELIKEYKFFPILSGSIIKKMLTQFDYFELSFERAVQKIHLIVQQYLDSIKAKQDILELIEILSSSDEDLDNNLYGKLRKSIIGSLNAFFMIEKQVFHQKRNLASKLLDFLCQEDIAYGLPLSITVNLNSLEAASGLANSIANIIQAQNFEGFKFITDKIINIGKVDRFSITPAKSKSKTDKRLDALLQKSKKNDEPSQNISFVKNEISNYLRMFIKEHFVDAYSELEEKLPNLSYRDVDALNEGAQPDLLGSLYTTLSDNSMDKYPRSETMILFQIFQDFGIKIDLSQSYEAFKDMYQKTNKSANKKIMDQAFVVALNELKYLGLISETRKANLTIQKNFFGKTFFREKHMIFEEDADKDNE